MRTNIDINLKQPNTLKEETTKTLVEEL